MLAPMSPPVPLARGLRRQRAVPRALLLVSLSTAACQGAARPEPPARPDALPAAERSSPAVRHLVELSLVLDAPGLPTADRGLTALVEGDREERFHLEELAPSGSEDDCHVLDATKPRHPIGPDDGWLKLRVRPDTAGWVLECEGRLPTGSLNSARWVVLQGAQFIPTGRQILVASSTDLSTGWTHKLFASIRAR